MLLDAISVIPPSLLLDRRIGINDMDRIGQQKERCRNVEIVLNSRSRCPRDDDPQADLTLGPLLLWNEEPITDGRGRLIRPGIFRESANRSTGVCVCVVGVLCVGGDENGT